MDNKKAAKHITFFMCFLFFMGAGQPLVAQVSAPLFMMPDNFYGQMANPAYMRNDDATTIAVPLMSGFSFGNHGNVKLTDIIVVSEAGKPIVRFDRFAQLAKPDNHIGQMLSVPLLYYSFPVKNGALSFYYGENSATSAKFKKDAFDFVLHGNSIEGYRSFDTREINFFALGYHEFAFGYARKLNDSWWVGARAKILFGEFLANAENWSYGLETSDDGGEVRLYSEGKGRLYSPLPLVLTDNKKIDGVVSRNVLQKYLLNFSNPGLAIDLGFSYFIDEQNTITFAARDLGGIWFRKNAMDILQEGNHTFLGFDITGAVGSPGDPGYVDSEWSVYYEKVKIRDVFQPTTDTAHFVQGLVPKTALHYQYNYSDKLKFGLTNQSMFTPYKFRNILSVSSIQRSANFSVFENVSLHELNNITIGAGLQFESDKFQAFVAIDNLLAAYHPANQRTYFLSFGTSFLLNSEKAALFGKRKKIKGENGKTSDELPFFEKKR